MIQEAVQHPSAAQPAAGTGLSDDQLQFMTDQIRVNGYTILENVLPLELIDLLRERFDVLLEERRRADPPNRGANRYQMFLPFELPFADPLVYEHPAVMQILERLMGSDFICTYLASDTPLPGSDYQQVHSDTRLLFPETTLSLPCYGLVANIPLVDFNEENGAMEIWPGGTHLMPGRTDLKLHAPQMQSIRPEIRVGSILMRDLRMWHRGTPNRSTRSRPNLALVYTRPWYRFEQRPILIPRSAYDALPERTRAMFRFNTLTPDGS